MPSAPVLAALLAAVGGAALWAGAEPAPTARRLEAGGCESTWDAYEAELALTVADTAVSVFWTVGDASLDVAVRVGAQGWLGHGFNAEPAAMIGSDVVLYTDAGVTTAHITAKTLSGIEADSQVLLNSSAGYAGGVTELRYSRAFDDGGSLVLAPEADPEVNMVVAWSNEESLELARHYTHKTALAVNLLTCDFSEASHMNAKLAHAVLMTWAFGLQLPAGALLARYYKHQRKLFFVMHRATQLLALFLAAMGLSIVLAYVYDPAYLPAHGKIGFTLMTLLALQGAGGLARESWRSAFAPAHRLLGRVTVVGGLAQIYVGLYQFQEEEGRSHSWGGLLSLNLGFSLGSIILVLWHEYQLYTAVFDPHREALKNGTTNWTG